MGVITVWEQREMWQRVISRDLNALHVYFYMHLLESELPKIPTDQSRCCHWLDRFSFVHMSAPISPQLKQWWWKCSKTLWGYKLDYHPLLWPHTHTHIHTHTHTHTHRMSLSPPASLLHHLFFFPFFFSIRAHHILSLKVCVWRIFILTCFFYCSLDALQLWAVMCLIDNEAKGRNKGREGWRRRVTGDGEREQVRHASIG